jgi:hypothetical protein
MILDPDLIPDGYLLVIRYMLRNGLHFDWKPGVTEEQKQEWYQKCREAGLEVSDKLLAE